MDEIFYAVRLYRYKQTLLGGNSWKETWLQLKTNGSLIWYNDKQCSKAFGLLNINNVASYVKIGQVAKRKLSKICPKLPFEFSDASCLMAIPDRSGERYQDIQKWYWFCFKSDKDLLITLQQFAKFFDYEREFEEFFNYVESQHSDDRYRRYGTPLSGEKVMHTSTNGTQDWGLLWEKFMIEIAPNRFLRRRRKGKRHSRIEEVVLHPDTDMFSALPTKTDRKDSCLDTESGDSYPTTSEPSHFDSEDMEIHSSDDESVSRKSQVTVEIHYEGTTA